MLCTSAIGDVIVTLNPVLEGQWKRARKVETQIRFLVRGLNILIENPFQNWSRNTADMMGTVFLWLDYAIPVEPLREEFGRLLRQAPQWDGRIETVQVTDSNERALQIRFLMSAPDSSQAWDLRCAVREGLVAFV